MSWCVHLMKLINPLQLLLVVSFHFVFVSQERLLLSVLPEHVAVKVRQDLGSDDSEQFKKIYMSRHENVRYDRVWMIEIDEKFISVITIRTRSDRKLAHEKLTQFHSFCPTSVRPLYRKQYIVCGHCRIHSHFIDVFGTGFGENVERTVCAIRSTRWGNLFIRYLSIEINKQ